MSTPQGEGYRAETVLYQFETADTAPWLSGCAFEVAVGTGTSGELKHTLAEVAADAMLAHLREHYPDADIRASRTYTGTIEGAPWPQEAS